MWQEMEACCKQGAITKVKGITASEPWKYTPGTNLRPISRLKSTHSCSRNKLKQNLPNTQRINIRSASQQETERSCNKEGFTSWVCPVIIIVATIYDQLGPATSEDFPPWM